MSLNTRNFRCLLLVPALLAVGGCSDVSWPWSRHRDTAAVAPVAPGSNGGSDKGSDNAADCAQLQTEIRTTRSAGATRTTESTSPEIVAAAEAKAGQQSTRCARASMRSTAPARPIRATGALP